MRGPRKEPVSRRRSIAFVLAAAGGLAVALPIWFASPVELRIFLGCVWVALYLSLLATFFPDVFFGRASSHRRPTRTISKALALALAVSAAVILILHFVTGNVLVSLVLGALVTLIAT